MDCVVDGDELQLEVFFMFVLNMNPQLCIISLRDNVKTGLVIHMK